MLSKEEIEKAVNHFIEHHDVESAIVITKALLSGYIVIEDGRRNITRDTMSVILADYEQLEAEKQEVIDYLKEEIDTMGSGKGMFLVKTALGAVLEKIMKGEKKHESND